MFPQMRTAENKAAADGQQRAAGQTLTVHQGVGFE